MQNRPRILIVEDNLLIAMEVEDMVAQCGCAVAGPVANVEEGLRAVRELRLQGAVLDINLGDERIWPVAELLAERAVPFLLASGYSRADMPERFRRCPLLPKPLTVQALGRALREIGVLGP